MRLIYMFVLFAMLSACSKNDSKTQNIDEGMQVFARNCIMCHGKNARGIVRDWKKIGVDGKYPAPPLNGSAHTWHHSPAQLIRIINNGSIKEGGSMPSFKESLTNKEKQAVLDYIFSLWPEEIKTQYYNKYGKI